MIIFPKTPNVDPATAASVWFVGITVTDATAEAIVESMELTELPTREETVSEAMIPDQKIVNYLAESTAIHKYSTLAYR
ncbi:hypothetical protein BHYA_0124g00050 [Botrytis hyacinthi]|uniref:Uncharacterized protein n=1 Tax=Botrytis hyacinthi TaxID=278943 RepID=A0A4Z1GHP1_9HELO|nr:hypothetical protein BHYA_0124g00050 [Botrytis hyacinthi]